MSTLASRLHVIHRLKRYSNLIALANFCDRVYAHRIWPTGSLFFALFASSQIVFRYFLIDESYQETYLHVISK